MKVPASLAVPALLIYVLLGAGFFGGVFAAVSGAIAGWYAIYRGLRWLWVAL